MNAGKNDKFNCSSYFKSLCRLHVFLGQYSWKKTGKPSYWSIKFCLYNTRQAAIGSVRVSRHKEMCDACQIISLQNSPRRIFWYRVSILPLFCCQLLPEFPSLIIDLLAFCIHPVGQRDNQYAQCSLMLQILLIRKTYSQL